MTADGHGDEIVQPQRDYRRAATGGAAEYLSAVGVPLEMLGPDLAARVVHVYLVACFRIDSMGLIALEVVAQPASKPQIVLFVRTAVCCRNDVFNFQRTEDQVLGAKTIPATISGWVPTR